MSLHAVPIYDTLGEGAVEYIVDHSESVAVFVSDKKFASLLKALASPKLKARVKTVVYWGAVDEAQVTRRRGKTCTTCVARHGM